MAMATAAPDEEQIREENTEEDEVLHELDVYVSRSLGKLMLAQYPLRPTYKAYGSAGRNHVRVRPVQCELEMEMNIKNNPNQPLRTQKLSVLQRPLLKPNAAIGLLKGRELHLTPLDSIIQLTPSFDHVDKRAAEDAKLNEKVEDSAPAAVSVTRRITKVETDRDKAMRLESYEYVQQERKSEVWVPCDYRPTEHPYTAGQKRAMICKKEKKGVAGMEVSKRAYLDQLLPEEIIPEYLARQDASIGLHDLARLNPSKQVESLMMSAQILSYREICSILHNLPEADIISELQNCANLVQGHWVISSKMLYPKGSRSGQTGVPAELMVRHRDFILCCFVHNPVLKRKHLTTISRIPAQEIEEVLKQVSTFSPHEGWTLKGAPCIDFARKYPDVESSQRAKWREIYDDVYMSLHLKAHRSNPLVEKRIERSSSVSRELTNLTAEAAAGIVTRLGLDDVVQPEQLIELSHQFRELLGQGAGLVGDVEGAMLRCVPPEHLKSVLTEMCTALHICFISALTQDGDREEALAYLKIGNSASDKYRQVMFSLFESRYQISKSELRDTILQQMQTSVTNKEYHSITTVLCDSPTAYKSGHWVLKIKRGSCD